MKTTNRRSLGALLCILAACVLFPTEARADAINFGFVAVAGVVVLVPLTLFTVLVEGLVLALGFRIPYRRTLMVMLTANLASLAAGIPVKIFNAWMYSQILPRPLAPYFRQYPYAVCLGSVVFLVVTLITEYAVIAAWLRRKQIEISRRRLATVVLIANTITYAVLAPLHYIATRPTNDVREFTDGSTWAERPATELLYVSSTGNLCSVTTDGEDMRVRVPDMVRDYQYIPSQGIYLYRDGSNNLCAFRESDGTRIECWHTGERFMMEQVACSPDGKTIAYLSRVGKMLPYELVLHDIDSGRTARTGIITDTDDYDPEIAWSEDRGVLFLLSGRTFSSVAIGTNLTATSGEHVAGITTLATVYGRFSTGHWWGGDDWGASLSHDTNETVQAYAMPGLGSHLRITQRDSTWAVADNPGLLKLGNRGFSDVSLLDNAKELLFDDHHDIYLVNLEQRKVGRVVEGSKFITTSPRYQRKIVNANNGTEPIQ